MEFLNYKATLSELRPSGLVPDQSSEGDSIVRLTFAPGNAGAKSPAPRRAAVGSAAALEHCGQVDARHEIADPAATLPDLVESLLHKHKASEALFVPVGKWRAICDVLALELANDPSWQDVDAEAALHLNSHDPLLLTPRDFHVVPTMLSALLRAAPDDPSGEHDLTIVAAGVGMLLEFRPAGALVMTAANPSFVAELDEMV
ncbi:MAG: hypothetical protein ACTS27_05545 [Phycisphaerales bacterium]